MLPVRYYIILLIHTIIRMHNHSCPQRSTKEAFFNLYGIHSNHLSSVFKWENIIGKRNVVASVGILRYIAHRRLADYEPFLHSIPASAHTVSASIHPLVHIEVIPPSLPKRILVDNHWEAVFLLSGDDLCVHMFRETADDNVSLVSTYFPNLLPPCAHISFSLHRLISPPCFTRGRCATRRLLQLNGSPSSKGYPALPHT